MDPLLLASLSALGLLSLITLVLIARLTKRLSVSHAALGEGQVKVSTDQHRLAQDLARSLSTTLSDLLQRLEDMQKKESATVLLGIDSNNKNLNIFSALLQSRVETQRVLSEKLLSNFESNISALKEELQKLERSATELSSRVIEDMKRLIESGNEATVTSVGDAMGRIGKQVEAILAKMDEPISL